MKAPLLIFIATLLVACGDGSNTTDKTSRATTESAEAALGKAGPGDARAARVIAGSVAGVAAPPPSVNFSGAMADQTSTDAIRGSDPLQSVTAATSGAPAMVIRTGQAFVEVAKVDPAVLRIRQLAAQVGGYIANSSMSGGRDQIRQATLEIKIPSTRYDEAVSSLSA